DPASAGIESDAEALGRLFVQVETHLSGTNSSTPQLLRGTLARSTIDLSAPLLPLAEDRTRPRELRLAALQLCAEHGGERAANALVDIADSDNHYASGSEIGTLYGAGAAMPAPLAIDTLARLVASPKSQDGIVHAFAQGISDKVPMPAELGRAVL